MNSKYKKKASENLEMWCERLSENIILARLTQDEVFEVLHELSVTSYLEGAKAEQDNMKKK